MLIVRTNRVSTITSRYQTTLRCFILRAMVLIRCIKNSSLSGDQQEQSDISIGLFNSFQFAIGKGIFFAILLVTNVAVSSSANGQPAFQQHDLQMTNLEMNNESLKILFLRLTEQTGLSFVYSGEVSEVKNIKFPLAQRTIREVLDLVSRQTGLSFRLRGNAVLVYNNGRAANNNQPNSTMILTVSGKVTDAATLQPLPGVSILIKGSADGTTTDADGQYALDVSQNDVLVFSFIGHKTVETRVDGKTSLDVSLEEEASTLEEVVINGGYYRTTDRIKTGNIAKITSKEIEHQPVTSPLMALQGRVPGLEITPQSGTPGSAPTIRIRGTNSLRNGRAGNPNGNYPLYIVDGVPINSAPVQSVSFSFMSAGFDPLSTISPDNIESIEILKDADATAIYGSRGANGVILITTKQGKTMSRTNIEIGYYSGIGQASNNLQLLNNREYFEMRREAFYNDRILPNSNNAPDLILWDTTRHTNWQKVLLGGTANISDAQLTISGGNNRTSFRLASGYHKETMIFPGDFWYDRSTANLSVNHSSSNDKFNASLSINTGINRNKLFDDANFVNMALFLAPNAPGVFDKTGDLNWEVDPSTGLNSWVNPLSLLRKSNESRTFSLIMNGAFDYELFNGLTLKTSLGLTEFHANEFSINPLSSRPPSERVSPNAVALSYFGNNQRQAWTIEPQVAYRKTYNIHSVDIIVGSTFQQNTFQFQRIEGRYNSDEFIQSLLAANSLAYTIDDRTIYRFSSLFARIGYNFRSKYYLNITGRRDGSSRFGPGNKFGNFSSVGFAWIFSNEAVFKEKLKFISLGKLRASYGLTGNDQIGDYQYYDLYRVGSSYNNTPGLFPDALLNPNFAWEKTKKLEIATQIGLFNDRITLEASWYNHRSDNQLVNYPLPATTGFPSILRNFSALVENSGLELLLGSTILSKKEFSWSVSFNYTVPKNKLIEFNGIEDSPYQQTYQVGKPLSVQRLLKWTGVDPHTGQHTFMDLNDDGQIDDSDKIFQDVLRRKSYGGFTNNIHFKQFDLSFLLQFSKQDANKFMLAVPGVRNNQPVSVLSRWRNEGDVTDIARYSQNLSPEAYRPFSNYLSSDAIITDGSFIKLKTLALSYTLSNDVLKKVKLQKAKIFFQGQNLFTISSLKNLDPETGTYLPPLQVFTVGIQIIF